jgi:hypothetical protein
MDARRDDDQVVRQRGMLELDRLLNTEAAAPCEPRLQNAAMPNLALHGVVINQGCLG